MNKDDIIRMAWKANIPSCHITHPKALERFAALVAAHKEKECVEMCAVLRKMAIEKEREECAKVCDVLAVDPEYASQITKLAATAIRARG